MKLFEKALTLLVVGVTIVAIFFSCAKKDVPSFDEQNKLPYHPRVGTFRSLTMPTVSNGMLVFSDQKHINEYIDYLDAIIMDEPQSEDEEDADTTEIDDKLQVVENALSFRSLRSELVAAFELLNETGFETLEDIPEEHFIASSSIRSVLNPNYEVKIGNSIWVYYNEDYMLEITDGDIEKRDAIRGFRHDSPGEIHASIYFIPNVVPYGNGKIVCQLPLVTNTSGSYSNHSGGGAAPLYDTVFVLLGTSEKFPCQPFDAEFTIDLLVEIRDTSGFIIQNPIRLTSSANYDWDFDDGNSVQVSGGTGAVTHHYSTTGTYDVSVTVNYSGPYGILDTVYNYSPLNISGKQCKNANFNEESTPARIQIGSSNVAYSWRTQGQHYGGGWTRDKITSYTKSYRRNNSSSNWRYRKVDRVAVVMSGVIKDSGCNDYTVSKSAWPYNAKCAETVLKFDNFEIYNDDLHLDHRVWHNTVYNQDLQDLPTVCQ